MARTIYVKKARKDQPNCQAHVCKHESREIKAGDPYKHFSMKLQRGGRRFVFHTDCTIRPSQRTTSRMGEIYDAQEDAETSIPQEPDEIGTLETIAQDFAQTVREVGEGYGESSDNIESGFGHSTYVSDELREKADSLESWADELESLDFEEFDEADARETAEQEARDEADSDDPADDVIEEKVEEQRQNWWEEQVSKLNDEIGNCPV